jgi:hypothetical protein
MEIGQAQDVVITRRDYEATIATEGERDDYIGMRLDNSEVFTE